MSRVILPVTLVAVSVSACGSTPCGGLSADGDAAAPHIASFFVLSDDKQIPGDPWTVVFGLEFKDASPSAEPNIGDLGIGRAEFYLNSKTEPVTFQLDNLFRQNGLAATAAEGAFWVHLRFAESTVGDGTRVRLGAQLVDAADLRSNCFTLDLEFDVYPAASLEPVTPSWRVASTRCRGEGRS